MSRARSIHEHPRLPRGGLLAALASAACGASPAPEPIAVPVLSADVLPGRLVPAHALDPAVTPTAYHLDLELDPDQTGYRGEVAIDLALARPTRTVWLHAVDLVIDGASFAEGEPSGSPSAPARGASIIAGAAGSELIGLDLDRAAPAGTGRLSLRFHGAYRTAEGIFVRQRRGRQYVFSDFEPVDARRAFPCFDEPRFKTPWTVSLVVPAGMVALGNMPVALARGAGDGRTRVELAVTRPLPTYLVAVAAGPFEVLEAAGASVPVRVVVPEGLGAAAEKARELAPEMIATAVDFLDRPVPFPKLDFVAVPAFSGAMENPGLITVNEDILLAAAGDPDAERLLALVLAHEASHLWFGDLVTPAAWHELWLNEGFASWMADEILAAARPEWHTWIDELDGRAAAFAEDAVAGAGPLRPIETAAPRELFDVLRYQKGAAVLHMIQGWLGDDAVHAALDGYLDAHHDGSVTTADLVAALAAAAPAHATELAAVAASFVEQPGAPRIDGQVHCSPDAARVALRSRRQGPPGMPGGPWSIPICLRWRDEAGDHRRCQVVAQAAEIPLGPSCPRWLTLSADGTGYYAWALAASDLARVVTATDAGERERLDTIRQLEPALFASALSIDGAVTVLDAALRHGDTRVAAAALDVIRLLRDEVAPDAAARLMPAVTARLRPLGHHPRPDDSDGVRRLREGLLVAAGRGGDPKVVAWARREAARWRSGHPDARDPLTTAAATIAVAAGDRDVLAELALAVHGSDRVAALGAARALAAVPPELVDRVVDIGTSKVSTERQGAILCGLLSRKATATAALEATLEAASANLTLAVQIAEVAPCDTALNARIATSAAGRAVTRRALARAATRAAACEALRQRNQAMSGGTAGTD